jgi:8-oxo-dGTP pyrophosphatase MutT (NUDIX family)
MSPRWKPSVTVAAVAGRLRGGQVEYLLVEEETAEGLRLNNPAGHLDPGESPEQAVVREALEETGRVFVPESLVGVYLARTPRDGDGNDTTYVRFAFAGRAGEADPARALDTGIVRTLWMTLDELRDSRDRHRSPLLLRSVEDAAAGRRFPLDAIRTDPSVDGRR